MQNVIIYRDYPRDEPKPVQLLTKRPKRSLWWAHLLTALGLAGMYVSGVHIHRAMDKPDLCSIVEHWSATVDGKQAMEVNLHCKRRGDLRLVLSK